MWKNIGCLVLCFWTAFPIQSAENDPYLAWNKPLKDSKQIINAYINTEIKRILGEAEIQSDLTCHDMAYKVGMFFSDGYQKNTLEWVEKNEEIEVHPPRNVSAADYFKQSIYRDGHYLHLARILNFGGFYIGTDKIAHSISLGFVYYMFYHRKMERALEDGMEEDVAHKKFSQEMIAFGMDSERTILGLWSTHVYSRGDLEANFRGMDFYINLCKKPHFLKTAEGWKLVEPIDFTQYASPHWDESYTPSVFKKSRHQEIGARIKEHCEERHDDAVVAKKDFYDSFSNKPLSLNMQHLNSLLGQGNFSNDFHIDRLCGEALKSN